MFNGVDEERQKLYGPERTCAEWLLRNGAKLKWRGTTSFLKDYNQLPIETEKCCIMEIDASDSSISHFGFLHLVGCKYIEKVILCNCWYLEDSALKMLVVIKESLKHLEISKCGNITPEGLMCIGKLNNLETLILSDLIAVKDIKEVASYLKQMLPGCNINI